METETTTLADSVTACESRTGARTIVTRGAGQHVALSREALQALVQYAYDRHGILASPSYTLEAERATEAKPGGCPCGLEGCSDRPAYVDEYRTGLHVGAL